jgi:hypothetical protein
MDTSRLPIVEQDDQKWPENGFSKVHTAMHYTASRPVLVSGNTDVSCRKPGLVRVFVSLPAAVLVWRKRKGSEDTRMLH